jgi:hypothetical protein
MYRIVAVQVDHVKSWNRALGCATRDEVRLIILGLIGGLCPAQSGRENDYQFLIIHIIRTL